MPARVSRKNLPFPRNGEGFFEVVPVGSAVHAARRSTRGGRRLSRARPITRPRKRPSHSEGLSGVGGEGGLHTSFEINGLQAALYRDTYWNTNKSPTHSWHACWIALANVHLNCHYVGRISPVVTTAQPTNQTNPCWHCQHWGGWAHGGPHSYCRRPGCSPVQAIPERGCAYWVREPGADDEPGPPATGRQVPPRSPAA